MSQAIRKKNQAAQARTEETRSRRVATIMGHSSTKDVRTAEDSSVGDDSRTVSNCSSTYFAVVTRLAPKTCCKYAMQIFLVLLVILLVGCGGEAAEEATPTPSPTPTPTPTLVSEEVFFPDPSLEAALRKELAKAEGAIYAAELRGLTSLRASNSGITDLSGLEHLTTLTSLQLDRNQISDASPLANLTSLTYLRLGRNQISDISPLAKLTGLEHLYLYGNQISDISPLAGLTGLTSLTLSNNQVSDLSPLENLTKPTSLLLEDNQIVDIEPLVYASEPRYWDGAFVGLIGNPLSPDSRLYHISALRAGGVTVDWD